MPPNFCRCFQVVAPFFLVLFGFESPWGSNAGLQLVCAFFLPCAAT